MADVNGRATAALSTLRVLAEHVDVAVSELPVGVRTCDPPPLHQLRAVAHAALALAKMAEAAEESLYG